MLFSAHHSQRPCALAPLVLHCSLTLHPRACVTLPSGLPSDHSHPFLQPRVPSCQGCFFSILTDSNSPGKYNLHGCQCFHSEPWGCVIPQLGLSPPAVSFHPTQLPLCRCRQPQIHLLSLQTFPVEIHRWDNSGCKL